jgi:two-component system response regulator LytT
MKILIIEDEQPAARRLTRLIAELRPAAVVLDCLDSIEDAVNYFEKEVHPDLVLMDIQLADGISFDIFSRTKVSAPVIFTTAYDHYALKAFKVNSIDYLLKPIEIAELESALVKFELMHQQGSKEQVDFVKMMKLIREKSDPYKKRFLVKTAGRLTFIQIEDVAFFFSDAGNTFLVTTGNDRFLIESILEEMEEQLDPSLFFRINRKMVVSLNSIKRIEPHFNNRFLLNLQPEMEDEVVVSRQRSAEFRKWLDA